MKIVQIIVVVLFGFFSFGFQHATEQIHFGDLWSIYGEKPKEVIFLNCVGASGQRLATATYRVDGVHHRKIENLLVSKYGMGILVKTAIFWEPQFGQLGVIKSNLLRGQNPEYTMTISMGAEMDTKNGKLSTREEQRYFYMTVVIWDAI